MQFIIGGFKGCRDKWVDGFDEPPLSPLLSRTLAGMGHSANRWRLPTIRAVREGNLADGMFLLCVYQNMASQMKFSGPHGKVEVFELHGKSKNNMDQIAKTNISDINSAYVKTNFQLKVSFLKEMRLSRLWDFCHANYTLVSFYTFRNGYCGGMILLTINRWIFLRYLQLCWITNISLLFHHRKDFMYNYYSSKVYIHGTANTGHASCREHELPYNT